MSIKEGKLLYHQTALDNIPSIVKHGLLPRSYLLNKNDKFCDVADDAIIIERQKFGLNDYIPFHFHPRTPFDYAVRGKYPGKEFVYICIKRDVARDNGAVILPKHPLSIDELELLPYNEGFSKIDWEVMEQSSRNSSAAHATRMAECLMSGMISVSWFHEISVKDGIVRNKVNSYLNALPSNAVKPFVEIKPYF